MPNRPLVKTPIFVPLYAGLSTEVADKLVQPQNGVLELENMVCALTGEMSKRDGSADLATPTTPTLPTGGTLPTLYELAGYKDQLVRLSVMGPSPLWPWAADEQSWLLPSPPGAGTPVASVFRGPIGVDTTPIVNGVTVGTSAQTPSSCTAGSFILAAYEQYAQNTQSNVGIVELVLDAQTKEPVLTTPSATQAFRPRCVTVGQYMLCFFVDLFDGTVRVDLYDSTNIQSLSAQYVLTAAGAAGVTSLLAVTAKDSTTATVVYTGAGTNAATAIDFVPSTAAITLYGLRTNAAASITATGVLAFVQDLGGSGKLSLISQEATNGVVVHWGFGAISGSLSTATADYVIDSSFTGKGVPSDKFTTGVWNAAAYTTSTSSTGEFVVMYDSLATGDTAKAIVYRGARVGSTVTRGAEYWYGVSLVSEFYQPGDGGTYILTTFSNSAQPTTPQNTFFVCVDGLAQPAPQATALPQGAGGISRRSSALTPVIHVGGARDIAVPTLADVQFIGGVVTQLFGVSLLALTPLAQQDTTTSPPVEAFGSLLVPGGTLMAYDGRNYGEAIFANRPEPPILIPTSTGTGSTVSITHNAADQVIGAPVQPLAGTAGDVVMGALTVVPTTGGASAVQAGGGIAIYRIKGAFTLQFLSIRALNQLLIGATLSVASSGVAGNDGSFTITSVQGEFSVTGPNPILTGVDFVVTQTTQTSAILGGGTVMSVTPTNPARFFLLAPGIPVITDDPTFAGQNLIVTPVAPRTLYGMTEPQNTGSFTLDATHPCGTQTLNGTVFSFLYGSSALSTAVFEDFQTPASFSLQLADPTTANTWTITNASFDQTYVGSVLTVVNTLNPGNSDSFLILKVIDATHIVTSGPRSNPGGIIRNEFTGATTAVTYTVTVEQNIGIGKHEYCQIFSRVDANGRKWRSPPSIPVEVTTTPTNPSVTAVCSYLNATGQNCNVELYRSQTDVGGAFNLVQSIPNNPHSLAGVINDFYSDREIALQEELFSDGGILPGTPLPSVRLIAVHQGRVFVVSPESPQSLFYSNPDGAGSGGAGDGLLFDTTNLSLDIIDQHGFINAIQALDNTLVTIKGDSVYAVNGTGPDGSGQNGGYAASLIASGVGTNNPRSIALQVGTGTAPGGVWFQSEATRAGIHTVTRGLTVEYTGGGVRRYSQETIISSLVYPALTQVRWYTASGRTLIYDWTSKLWGTNTGQPCLSALLFNGLPVVAASDTFAGYVLEETPGLYEDGELVGVYAPYAQRVASAWLSVGGLAGYQRTRRIQGVGKAVGAHVLTVLLYANYDDTNLIGTASKTFAAGDDWDWELLPAIQKVDAIKVVLIGTDLPGAITGTAGFSVTGLALLVAGKQGLGKVPDRNRMT